MIRVLRKLVFCTLVAALLLGSAACPDGGSEEASSPADTLTRRQKDSIVGQSGLPGARGVQRVMEAADRQKARTDRLDSISKNP